MKNMWLVAGIILTIMPACSNIGNKIRYLCATPVGNVDIPAGKGSYDRGVVIYNAGGTNLYIPFQDCVGLETKESE